MLVLAVFAQAISIILIQRSDDDLLPCCDRQRIVGFPCHFFDLIAQRICYLYDRPCRWPGLPLSVLILYLQLQRHLFFFSYRRVVLDLFKIGFPYLVDIAFSCDIFFPDHQCAFRSVHEGYL